MREKIYEARVRIRMRVRSGYADARIFLNLEYDMAKIR